jgi:hypothetical protein
VHVIARVPIVPLIGDEDSVDLLQGGVSALIALSEHATLEVNLFQRCLFYKPPELAHELPIQATIVLVTSSVNHIEVPVKHLGANPHLSKSIKLRQEIRFLLIGSWTINGSEPPFFASCHELQSYQD